MLYEAPMTNLAVINATTIREQDLSKEIKKIM